ncbi:hypothetical protein PRIC1_012659 [Phytophthora ramorum]
MGTSDSVWIDDLEMLFRDDRPGPVNSSEAIQSSRSTSKEKSKMATKTLTLPQAVPVSTATKRTSSRPRASHKKEIEYLRTKVKEMETKLQELKEPPKAATPIAPSSPDDELSIALWKTLAGRQKNQRELVEVENAKLREKLKTQVRMAKSLHRVLCKRAREGDLSATAPPKRSRPLLQCEKSVTTLFNEMLQCLDELYVEASRQIASSPAASMSIPVIRTKDVKYNDVAGMFLEFQDSKILPFDMHTASRAMWRFLTETGHKYNNYVEEHVETRDNTMLRKFGVEIKHGNSVAVLFGRQVTRRYVESDRVVLVRHSIIDEIQMSGATAGGLTFRESGWIVVKNSPEVPGTGAATLTQASSTMSPDIDLNSQWEVGALTDFVLQSREDIEVGNDTMIDNLLLEEAAKQKLIS